MASTRKILSRQRNVGSFACQRSSDCCGANASQRELLTLHNQRNFLRCVDIDENLDENLVVKNSTNGVQSVANIIKRVTGIRQ